MANKVNQQYNERIDCPTESANPEVKEAMSHHGANEFQIQQQIFLGGQVSHIHAFFKELAMISPRYALPYLLVSKMEELSKLDDDKLVESLLKYIGIADNMPNYTELTRLSMILGDTRKRYSLSGKDGDSTTPTT